MWLKHNASFHCLWLRPCLTFLPLIGHCSQPMHCSFFIGYCFTPTTYSMFPNNHSVDFFHVRMYLSKYPLCSTTCGGQDDIPVLTLLIFINDRMYLSQHLLVHNTCRLQWYSEHSLMLDFINGRICLSITSDYSIHLQIMVIYYTETTNYY